MTDKKKRHILGMKRKLHLAQQRLSSKWYGLFNKLVDTTLDKNACLRQYHYYWFYVTKIIFYYYFSVQCQAVP